MDKIKYFKRIIDKNENLDIPNILYKYRNWDDSNHQSIIKESKIYFASPKSFEDSNDCKNLVDYSLLTENELYEKVLSLCKKRNPNWDDAKCVNHTNKWLKESSQQDESPWQITYDLYNEYFEKCFGVLSLTPNKRNPTMWKKYANSRRGFCIGYDVKCWLNTNMTIGGGEVMYVSKLPKIHPNEDTTINYMRQIYTKEDKWDFEQEFRLHKNWFKHVTNQERQISVPTMCVKEIIFGANMPEKHKKEIRSIAKKKFPNVRFIKMNKNKSKI